MRGIFFTADDLGLSKEANDAILHAHTHGALHGAALMLGQPGTDYAVELARKHPRLRVGFHLHLCDSQPLTLGDGGWPWGSDPARAGWAIGTSRNARRIAEAEIARQWDEYRSTGLPCAFINAHHHLHVHPFVMPMLKEIVGMTEPQPAEAVESEIVPWWRWGKPRWFGSAKVTRVLVSAGWGIVRAMSWLPAGAQSPKTLWGIDRCFAMRAEEIRTAMALLLREDQMDSDRKSPPSFISTLRAPEHEFIFHPRRIHPDDKDLQCLLEMRE